MTQPKDITKPFNGKCKICNLVSTDTFLFASNSRCKSCYNADKRERMRVYRKSRSQDVIQYTKDMKKIYYDTHLASACSSRYANDESYRNRCRVASSVRALYISETRRFRNILIN